MTIQHHNEFSPEQTAWLAALESGKFEQSTESRLFKDGSYCCLGVACAIAGVPDRRMANEAYCLPNVAFNLQLHNVKGQLFYRNAPVEMKDIPNIQKMSGWHKGDDCLAEMNDSQYWTFGEIAAFIRARPWLVFKNFDAPEHFE